MLATGVVAWRVYDTNRTDGTSTQAEANPSQQPTDDEQVTAAARSYCQSKAQAGAQMDFGVGKIGPKAIIYSSDKHFAKMNVRCTVAGIEGGAMEYVLAKRATQWSVLYSGIEDKPTKEQEFGVPAHFE